jgi:hypothetical protein
MGSDGAVAVFFFLSLNMFWVDSFKGSENEFYLSELIKIPLDRSF